MKRLEIGLGGLALAELDLDRPVLVVGRSPACDSILRAPGVRPIHFVLEWLGEGEFDPDDDGNIWAVFSADMAIEGDATSEGGFDGNLVSEKGTSVDGFSFKFKKDRLAAPRITKNALTKQITEASEAAPVIATERMIVEVMRLAPDGEAVVSVEHVRKSKDARIALRGTDSILNVQFEKSSGAGARLVWAAETTRVRTIGSRGAGAIAGSERPLAAHEILHVKAGPDAFFVRLVPMQKSDPPKREALKDPFFLISTLTLVIGLAATYWASSTFAPVESTKEPPRRVATVEVKELVPTATPAPTPEPPKPAPTPVATPPPEAPVATPPPKAVEKVAKAPGGSQGSKAAAPSFNSPPRSKPKPGVNSPAPVADVNAVGLLGAMKKTKSGPAAKISADMVMNNGLISDTASGETGSVTVQQPPSGVVDLNAAKTSKAGGGGRDDLQSASTTLEGGGAFDPNSNGAIGRKGGKSGFSTGSGTKGLGGLGAGGGEGKGQGSGQGAGSGESVVGGLDRETVRKFVMARRQEIRACYERGLAMNPKLRGRVVPKWYISPSGPVSSIMLEHTELRQSTVESCVMSVIKSIVFPKAPNGQPTTVIYPFMFQNT